MRDVNGDMFAGGCLGFILGMLSTALFYWLVFFTKGWGYLCVGA